MKTDDCVEPVLQSIAAAEAHVRSEYVHDLAGTMTTVGARPHYAVTAEPGVIGVISGRQGVAALYEGAHNHAVPAASRFLTQIATDWYMFVENMPTRRWVADGSLRTVHTATLLVIDRDGLKGEFVWERPAPAAGAAAEPALLPVGSLRSLGLHEEFLAAVCRGDGLALGSLVDPGCTWAERDYLSGADGGTILELHGAAAAVDHFGQWHRRYRPERVSILNRQATDWYVFAEELWIVRPDRGGRRQYRKAVIYPVSPAGRIQGAIGFGTDPAAASPSADLSLGQAFWPDFATDASESRQRQRVPL
jgi:hypothetical protein